MRNNWRQKSEGGGIKAPTGGEVGEKLNNSGHPGVLDNAYEGRDAKK